MNIISFEIKRRLKTTIIWTVIISLVGLLYTAMGPAFINQSETLISFLSGMGEDFLKGFGINLDTFFSPAGFFGYIGGFIALVLAIQAMIYGIKAFVGEKNNKSIEFLYVKPNSRINIFIQKYIANIILLTITQVVVITILYFATDIINTVDYDHHLMFLLLLTFVPLQYMFFTLGTLIGVTVDRLKNIVAISIGIGIGMFFLNMLGGIIDNQIINYITFFNYYNLSDITFNNQYDSHFVLISIGIICFLTIISAIIFMKKDMKVQ